MTMIVITLDTETTGLLKDPLAHVVEIGAVKHNLVTGEILDSFSRFMCPSYLDDKRFAIAKKYAHIEKEEILNADSYQEVLPLFEDWAGNLPLFAWNLPFDQPMIMRSFHEMNQLETSLQFAGCWMHFYTAHYPEEAGKRHGGDQRCFSLEKSIQKEGIGTTVKHRALDDATMAALVAYKLISEKKFI